MKTNIYMIISLISLSCIAFIVAKNSKQQKQEKWYWSNSLDTTKFTNVKIEDIDKIPIADTVFIKMSVRSKKIKPLKKMINQKHKSLILKYIYRYKIPIEQISIGAPRKGYVNAIGVYVNNLLWLSMRENSAEIHTRKRNFQPPINYSELDNFFITNFKFTPEMLEAGLHGKVGIGFQIYPDSTLSIFEVMDTTLGIDKEIARVLHSTGKWTPAYDSITNNYIRSEMIYPFPIQHPDSAKLQPYEY
ncbi:hypothetical protein Fleli_0355 [Bernardetia litoralis DSM 6794]|uniref:Gram-negative bacterial tonB protein n=1 Tax=Bernardetia litoralis (strain ATCC 23117 / DSM 6794 / NBRC 15988 / NCIMB 1366 / Fx l1 / Sio-4) TaxID=880071 RepID=I4AFV1_BERLS|nr:hypothetical protein [Bernardetia litoralis]AFM02836.1 hypothetical protein Fleli_0355 [Bernardetia litoralis DSM 6794]